MIVTEVFFFTVVLLIARYVWQNWRFFYLASKIPKSYFDFSLNGIYNFLTADSKKLFEMSYESFKDAEGTVKTWLGPILMVILSNPEDVKIVMKAKECINKPRFVKFFGAPESILFGDYKSWHSHRKILNPYFNVQGVKAFVPIFNEKVKILMERVKEMEGKEEFNVFYYLIALSLETIMKVMEYDKDLINSGIENRKAFVKHLRDFLSSVSLRIFKPWLHPDFIYNRTKIYKDEQEALENTALRFSVQILENMHKKVKDSEPLKYESKSFIMELMDSNLTEKEIINEITTLLVAAQDTTALSSSCVLLLLALHNDVQEKVLAELQQVFGAVTEAPYIEYDQLNELTYLDKVINEAMRLMPVVPIVFREVDEEITLSDGYVIPRGANIIIPIHKIQTDKKIWGEDADKFRPERFENSSKISPYAFIPFTRGPRMCLGYRYAICLMKIQLANFLMKYEVSTSLKYEELEFELNTTLNVCQGYMIGIKERQL